MPDRTDQTVADAQRQIAQNIAAHDRVAKRYERRHGEIYNAHEQARLAEALARAANSIAQFQPHEEIFDFGCGAGNLTRHLLSLGLRVVSGDVSPEFLRLIERDFGGSPQSQTVLLNGADLSNLPDGRFALVATYSVLHHLPDYLAGIRELIRITRPGGIIYLDHEASEGYWSDPLYREFLSRADARSAWQKRLKYFSPRHYAAKARLLINPRYNEEGDIHVFPDDHIEWDRIEELLREEGCEIVERSDYLLFRSGCDEAVYRDYATRCSDMRLIAARKGG